MAGKKAREASAFDPALLENGSELKLKHADGQDSDDWVLVLSRWADPVRFTLDDTERRGHRELAAKGEIPDKLRAELIRDVWAACIGSWGGPSFDGTEPTKENKIAWLQANPQHGEAIERRSSADRFFMKASESSKPGSGKNSD